MDQREREERKKKKKEEGEKKGLFWRVGTAVIVVAIVTTLVSFFLLSFILSLYTSSLLCFLDIRRNNAMVDLEESPKNRQGKAARFGRKSLWTGQSHCELLRIRQALLSTNLTVP